MKIEIWSDILCPFCYIGKRNFEAALSQFEHKDNVEVVWKSYQLDPTMPNVPTENYVDYLVKRKAMQPEQVKNMLENVTETAKHAGLDYDLKHAVIVNSRKAHQLLQLAKTKGLANELEEQLFKAFFTDNKNIADEDVLSSIGSAVGLNINEIQHSFADPVYNDMVEKDIKEARDIGVQGVPFFVVDRKYAISGAQPPQVFLESLTEAYSK